MLLIANGFVVPSEVWRAHSAQRMALVFGITAAFALLGYLVGGVSRSGTVAGAAVCLALFWGAGPGAFLGLLALFGLTWAATRTGLATKRSRGTAENRGGRSASQVLANVGLAAVAALVFAATRERWLLLAMTAALAEPAADTVSSECGQAFSERVFLITSLERVEPGTNGGVSLAGTLSGTLASLLVSLVCVAACGLPQEWVYAAAVAGIAGMVADSLLGAIVEQRGWLGNDAVNLLGTVVAVLVAIALERA
jgi:uncharacterized protein (TIGR00297 family)